MINWQEVYRIEEHCLTKGPHHMSDECDECSIPKLLQVIETLREECMRAQDERNFLRTSLEEHLSKCKGVKQ
jgi:hypothetical protein